MTFSTRNGIVSNTCSNNNPNYLFASASKFFCAETAKVASSYERSVPLMLIPTGDIETNLRICKASFDVKTSPWSKAYAGKIKPVVSGDCIDLTFNDYKTGYQTNSFSTMQNITGSQIKAVSFSMRGLNIADNNAICSSFITPANKVSSSLEAHMLGNTALFSKGSFYILVLVPPCRR